jgi:DHA1 family inner membrane transport protein
VDNPTTGRRVAALLALSLGGFGLGLTEYVAMGLLPDIAHDLLPTGGGRSAAEGVATAGWMITVYALGVVVGAPTVAAMTARVPRRRLVLGLLALFVVGTVASAVAPVFALVLVGRFVAALGHGAYFGAASILAATILRPGTDGRGSQGRGFAIVVGGLTAANLVGVPVITGLGQTHGWRIAYLAVAVVFGVALLAVLTTVPTMAAAPGGSPRAELAAFRSAQVWLAGLAVAIGTGGFFAVNTYIAPVTTTVTGLSAGAVPWVMAVIGLGMSVGIAAGGIAADRDLRRSLVLGFVGMIVAVVLFALVAGHPVGLFVSVFLVGAAGPFVTPAAQSWLIAAAPRAQLMGAAVNQSASNVSNSIGAALGGAAIAAGWGYLASAWIGAALGVVGLVLVVLSFRRRAPAATHNLPATGHAHGCHPGRPMLDPTC